MKLSFENDQAQGRMHIDADDEGMRKGVFKNTEVKTNIYQYLIIIVFYLLISCVWGILLPV